MNMLSKQSSAKFRRRLESSSAGAAPKIKLYVRPFAAKQRGIVLFFALIALVIMSLAAVALIRSVDTSTMIAGNLAFKQSASSSGDAGLESAVNSMAAMQTLMDAANKSPFIDDDNVFNVTNQAAGYYSSAAAKCTSSNLPTKISTNVLEADCNPATPEKEVPIKWDNSDSVLVGTDSSGNAVRYVIQRMCRTENGRLSTADCLFSGMETDVNPHGVPVAPFYCDPTTMVCAKKGQAVMFVITSRISGPRDTLSYIQLLVY